MTVPALTMPQMEGDKNFCKFCHSDKYIKDYKRGYDIAKNHITPHFMKLVDFVNSAMAKPTTDIPDFLKDCLNICADTIRIAEFNYRRSYPVGNELRYERFTEEQCHVMASFLFVNIFNSIREDLEKNAQVQVI